jgi:hypothetical protein
LGKAHIFCAWTKKQTSPNIGWLAKGGIFLRAAALKISRTLKFWRIAMDYDSLLDLVKKGEVSGASSRIRSLMNASNK